MPLSLQISCCVSYIFFYSFDIPSQRLEYRITFVLTSFILSSFFLFSRYSSPIHFLQCLLDLFNLSRRFAVRIRCAISAPWMWASRRHWRRPVSLFLSLSLFMERQSTRKLGHSNKSRSLHRMKRATASVCCATAIVSVWRMMRHSRPSRVDMKRSRFYICQTFQSLYNNVAFLFIYLW